MSFLAPKTKLTPSPAAAPPPIETEVIRNPRNRIASNRVGSGVQSILKAGLAGISTGQRSLGGGA